MQIADIQEQPVVSPDSIKLIRLAIEKEKPDLVVFSGDQIYGLSPLYKGNTRAKVEKTISDILAPIEEAGIPFAVTFGNHDRQCGLTNREQISIYSKHKGFVDASANGDERNGVAFIPLFREEEHMFDVVLIDSNGQSPTGEYEAVDEGQLDSFRKQRELRRAADGLIPCMVIQHIPFEEYFNVIRKVKFGTKGAVEGFRKHKHEFFVLPDDIKQAGGFMLESPATPDRNSGEFSVLKEGGNCLAVSVGHDHNNSFVGELGGVKLIYTQGCGFNVYGPKRNRGVRIFDIDISGEKAELNTHTATFGELTSDRVSKPLQEFALTHIPTSMEQVKRLALIATAGSGVCALILLNEYRKYKRQ